MCSTGRNYFFSYFLFFFLFFFCFFLFFFLFFLFFKIRFFCQLWRYFALINLPHVYLSIYWLFYNRYRLTAPFAHFFCFCSPSFRKQQRKFKIHNIPCPFSPFSYISSTVLLSIPPPNPYPPDIIIYTHYRHPHLKCPIHSPNSNHTRKMQHLHGHYFPIG